MSGRLFGLAIAICGALFMLGFLHTLPLPASESPQVSSIIISEVAWSGTAAGGSYEWLELYNTGVEPVDLAGWELQDNELSITLSGTIQPSNYFVLERNEFALIDIAADLFLIGSLDDSGETIRLFDQSAALIDSANISGGPWPAGTASDDFRSMERIHPAAIDEPGSWISNNGTIRNGLDTDGKPVNGTPGMPNSSWPKTLQPNLVIRKSGPSYSDAGSEIRYGLAVSNTGESTANGVVLTDTLPPPVEFLDYDGSFPFSMPFSDTLVWQLGDIGSGDSLLFWFSATTKIDFRGMITNSAWVSTAQQETNVSDNQDSLVTAVGGSDSQVLIDAVYYDGYEDLDHDEAVRLINVGTGQQDLTGWSLSDGSHSALFPEGVILTSGEGIWVTDWGASFRRQFGHDPDYEVRGADPVIPNLSGTWPGFSNTGDEVLLLDSSGKIVDVLVYKEGDVSQTGWSGPALQPYAVTGVFASEGQILFRLPTADALSRLPDTDSYADWAQTRDDPVLGRRVRYPGWDFEQFYQTKWYTETGEMVIGIAPDNALELVQAEISNANSTLQIVSHTFRSEAIKQELLEALARGVSVTVLLEGAPVGGIDSAQSAICQELENAGGQCWLMISDPDLDIYDRYRYLHAKYIIVDESRVIVSSENLSPDSYPDDDKSDGTLGRRGVTIATNLPSIVAHFRSLWSADFDPLNHLDITRWSVSMVTSGPGVPPAEQLASIDWPTYHVRYAEPLRLSATFPVAVASAPENALGNDAGLLNLLAQAGTGDTVLVEQLSERPYWGASNSNQFQDPNPRLESVIEAARRGARVRLLLDSFFDDEESPISNLATCHYVDLIAQVERLDLDCERSNPAGLGLHNKMILAEIDGRGFVFAGSINGTELSNKGNREVALLFQSDGAYSLLADMFMHDWPHRVNFPLVLNDYVGPAQHVLISEVLYDPPGPDDAEFIELFNPTFWPLNLSGYSLSDAVQKSDFEDLRHFPGGATLAPGSSIVIATTATGFYAEFGFNPDFEIIDSDPLVPNLIDDTDWGDPAAILRLANMGDEVIVRNSSDEIVEAIAYGSGQVSGVISCQLNAIAGSVLERFPPWRDTDDCPADFREWPFPNPGTVP